MDERLYVIATAGSVDDGKSTLIGRLLYETGSLLDDQLEALSDATARRGERQINLALVTDGLRAEREQNITIDVAYRPFKTTRRRFILADSPGHEEYTRNMVTGASRADIVLVLADARRGLTQQTCRHLAIACLLQVPKIIVAINKMDLVDYSERIFDGLKKKLTELSGQLGRPAPQFVPISALVGDNVVDRSNAMPWYHGGSLCEILDKEPIENMPDMHGTGDIRSRSVPSLPIQLVLRGENSTRFYAGSMAAGSLKLGDTVVAPSGRKARVKAILRLGEPVSQADAGHPVAIQLDSELDIVRGDWLFGQESAPTISNTFLATIFWLHPDILRVGMTYQLRQGSRVVGAKVVELTSSLDFESCEFEPSTSLAMNEVGVGRVQLAQSVPLVTYAENHDLGSFILIDSHHQTVAAGRVDQVLDKRETEQRLSGRVVWLTGLSGAGKSTLAEASVEQLRLRNIPAVHLDADRLRTGINGDLGFSSSDRLENVRRTAEVAKLFRHEGFTVFCSVISPLREQRVLARTIVGEGFLEVFVDCGLDECVRRDTKGLYAKALAGTIKEFTGVSAPYERPINPELILDTEITDIDVCVSAILNALT